MAGFSFSKKCASEKSQSINYMNTSGIGDRAQGQNCEARLRKLKLRYFV